MRSLFPEEEIQRIASRVHGDGLFEKAMNALTVFNVLLIPQYSNWTKLV